MIVPQSRSNQLKVARTSHLKGIARRLLQTSPHPNRLTKRPIHRKRLLERPRKRQLMPVRRHKLDDQTRNQRSLETSLSSQLQGMSLRPTELRMLRPRKASPNQWTEQKSNHER